MVGCGPATSGRIWTALSLAGVFIAAFVMAVQGGMARAEARQGALFAEFDARGLSIEEKRVLQIGLTADGVYQGLLDGKWGRRSQAAIEAFVAASDPDMAAADLVLTYHAAELGRRAYDFLAETGLDWRAGPPWSHRMLAPPGDFLPEGDNELDAYALATRDLEIVVYHFLPYQVALFHDVLRDRVPAYEEPYVVRNASRRVTALDGPGASWYARSDRDPANAGRWVTTFVVLQQDGDRRVYEAVIASLQLDGGAGRNGGDGELKALIRAYMRLAVAEAPEAAPPPEPTAHAADEYAAGAPAAAPSLIGTGTGFFVNNTDLVTARHVVEDCTSVALVDGTRVDVVALHPTLDLALLAAQMRSRDWVPMSRTGRARLGQAIVALGYPYYGQVGTALNSTGGNVSALAGLHDDPDTLTISAPVQPGNSGGPLLAPDGTVVGVVIAQLGKGYMVEEAGSLPENVNYAVSGPALLDFLAQQAVSLPGVPAQAMDLGQGVPESVQRAVVPLLCSG